jgi:hypothetical protein
VPKNLAGIVASSHERSPYSQYGSRSGFLGALPGEVFSQLSDTY